MMDYKVPVGYVLQCCYYAAVELFGQNLPGNKRAVRLRVFYFRLILHGLGVLVVYSASWLLFLVAISYYTTAAIRWGVHRLSTLQYSRNNGRRVRIWKREVLWLLGDRRSIHLELLCCKTLVRPETSISQRYAAKVHKYSLDQIQSSAG